ncbi:MAG: cupredoxin domain-containing protein [Coriobacteriia bacterium]|nr:cupredoxin domain-containing protein [Coriobacteriia bacterium]MBN2839853.1 cupredoxin domain-containing protein [Coriobacteriia bacterium]
MRPTPRTALLVAAVLIVGIAFTITNAQSANTPGTTKTEGSRITRIVAKLEADSSMEIPVRLLEGSDAAHESAHIFDAIAGVRGVSSATLDTGTLVLTVAYDSASTDPAEVERALFSTGYAQAPPSEAVNAEMSADGTTQRVAVSDDGARLVPAVFQARAGLPLTVEFGPGTQCRTSIVFPELGVSADITSGATVELPAMEPGTYTIQCGGGGNEGVLIVQ